VRTAGVRLCSSRAGTGEGTYEIEGEQVKVTNNGETQLLTIDADGCLDGGRRIGKYCK
jgi:hypothetical protein